jgi:hypothetical protein
VTDDLLLLIWRHHYDFLFGHFHHRLQLVYEAITSSLTFALLLHLTRTEYYVELTLVNVEWHSPLLLCMLVCHLTEMCRKK